MSREFFVLEGLDGCYDLFFSWGIGLTSRSVSASCISASVGGGVPSIARLARLLS